MSPLLLFPLAAVVFLAVLLVRALRFVPSKAQEGSPEDIPADTEALAGRLQAMLRRARQPAFTQATSAQGGPSTTIGNLQLDHQGRVAALDGQPLELTQREWELLELLVNRCGEVVTRDDVLAAWRASPPEPGQTAAPLNSNALEVYVHRLRKKLDQSSLNIRNIRGLGYMLEKP